MKQEKAMIKYLKTLKTDELVKFSLLADLELKSRPTEDVLEVL